MIVSFFSQNEFEQLTAITALENFWRTFYASGHFVKAEWAKSLMQMAKHKSHAKKYIDEITASVHEGYVEVSAEGFWTNVVENGMDEFDMKPGLLRSKKARRSKDGSIYTIVPFRHNVKTLQAAGIYREIQSLDKDADVAGGVRVNINKRYRVVGQRTEKNAFGESTTRNEYSSGAKRFLAEGMRGYRGKNWPRGERSQSKFAGIVKTGSERHTGYVSFRVVSEKSPDWKWNHPGFPAQNIFGRIKSDIEAKVKRRLQDALLKDLKSVSGSEVQSGVA